MSDLSVSVSVPSAPAPSMPHQAEAPAKVTARDLNFYYGEHHALKNINLTLGANRVTAFIGPSGCGKSTLLRIFNRMYDLYPGQRATGQLMLDPPTSSIPSSISICCAPASAWCSRSRRRFR